MAPGIPGGHCPYEFAMSRVVELVETTLLSVLVGGALNPFSVSRILIMD